MQGTNIITRKLSYLLNVAQYVGGSLVMLRNSFVLGLGNMSTVARSPDLDSSMLAHGD